MFARVTATSSNTNFPLPQPDYFGTCNDKRAPNFLSNVDQASCQREITNLTTACETTLNPESFTTNIRYYLGSSTSSSSRLVNVNSILTLNSQNELVKSDDTAVEASVPNESECSCSGALLEAYYQVQYEGGVEGLGY